MDNQPIYLEQDELKVLWLASIVLLKRSILSEKNKIALTTAKEKIFELIEISELAEKA